MNGSWDAQDQATAALESKLARLVRAMQAARDPRPCSRCAARAAEIVTSACAPGEWWPGAVALRAHVERALEAEGLGLDQVPVPELAALKRKLDELTAEGRRRPWRS